MNVIVDIASIFVALLAAIVAVVGWISTARKASIIEHRHLTEVLALKEKAAMNEANAKWVPQLQGDIRELKADVCWLKKMIMKEQKL